MNDRFSRTVRGLHMYFGLFIGPFVLVFAVSVFFLVHAWLPKVRPDNAAPRVVEGFLLPAGLEQLSGRSLVDTLQPVLRQAGVYGEVGWVQHLAKENRFIVPVTIPGRRTTVTIDVTKREASIERWTTGLADALVTLHKSPGQHLAAIRMNWLFMRAWRWLADSTVCLTLFIAGSGVYLWYLLQAERRAGTWLLAAGAASFFGIVYALVS